MIPHIDLDGYHDMTVTVADMAVTEAEIDAQIVRLRPAHPDIADRRAELTRRTVMAKHQQAALALRRRTLNQLVRLVPADLELPAGMLRAETVRILVALADRLRENNKTLADYLADTGQTAEEFETDVAAAAAQNVRADLALRAVARNENVAVTAVDMDGEMQRRGLTMKDVAGGDLWEWLRSETAKTLALEWLLADVSTVDSAGQPVSV